jgi:hypothetical protein
MLLSIEDAKQRLAEYTPADAEVTEFGVSNVCAVWMREVEKRMVRFSAVCNRYTGSFISYVGNTITNIVTA